MKFGLWKVNLTAYYMLKQHTSNYSGLLFTEYRIALLKFLVEAETAGTDGCHHHTSLDMKSWNHNLLHSNSPLRLKRISEFLLFRKTNNNRELTRNSNDLITKLSHAMKLSQNVFTFLTVRTGADLIETEVCFIKCKSRNLLGQWVLGDRLHLTYR